MIQESIVDYINAQMKLGVSRDAIKATLTGAGWQVADVEDTLKKIEASKPAAQPMSMSAKPAEPVVASKLITPAGTSAGPEPQTIKVSDLISSSSSTMASTPMTATPISKSTGPKSPLTGPAPSVSVSSGPKAPTSFQATSYPGMKTHASRGALITEIVLAVVIVAIGAFAGFLYMQNSGLKSQLSSLNGQSSGVNSQLSALQAQMTASTTALTAQVASLGDENQELMTEISFYVAPTSTAPGASTTVALSGTVSGGGKVPYIITAVYGAKISVTNSTSASVIAALAPLEGTATTTPQSAQFAGTYVAGSDKITLTGVNGAALQ